MCQCTCCATGGGRGDRQGAICTIRFGTYNIWNGWNMGLESALHGMYQANMELGVFQETKLAKVFIHMRLLDTEWWRQRRRARTAAV